MTLENARRESKHLDFKERFDPNSYPECCELVKDIVAMANSGGGVILIGVKDNGDPSGFDVTSFLTLDPAKLTDKVAKFTQEQFSSFHVDTIMRNGQQAAALHIDGSAFPMVFSEAGVYTLPSGQQKTAFAKGTIYFRHGAKSEPANTHDIRQVIESELEHRRKSWLSNIRKVIQAPVGSHIKVLPPEVHESTLPDAIPIRLVDDLSAPPYRQLDPDQTHPYRQTELIQVMNEKLGHSKKITPYDLQAVRHVYGIDLREKYFHKPKFGSPQYSDTFVEWLMEQYASDNAFFDQARQRYRGDILTQTRSQREQHADHPVAVDIVMPMVAMN